MSTLDTHQTPKEDSALIELLSGGRKYFREIRKHWKLIALITAVCLIGSFVLMKMGKTRFQAELTFMVNEDEGSKLSGLSTALENIGLGFAASTSEYNLEKIMELMRSRRIIGQALMVRDTVDGQEDFFANHFIRIYRLREEWEWEKPMIKDLVFTHDSLDAFTLEENTGLSILHKMILGNSSKPIILQSEILDLPAIMNFTITTRKEELSYKFAWALFDKISFFYIDKTTEKQRETYKLVSSETDSIRSVLASREYDLARFQDQNQGLVGYRAQVEQERLEREVLILSTLYAEAVSNQEVAKFTLQNTTPFIQSIDMPVPPLKRVRTTLKTAIVRGLLLGLFLSLGFVIGRRVIRDTLRNLPAETEEEY